MNPQDTLEQILVNNDKHNTDQTKLIETLITQNENNNPEPLLQASVIAQNSILEEARKANQIAEETKNEVSKSSVNIFNIETDGAQTITLKGDKGDPGINPLVTSQEEPKNPIIGDLWYQP